MQFPKAGILVAAVVGWVTAQAPVPPPERGPGPDREPPQAGRPLPDDGPGGPGDPPPPPPPPFGLPPDPLFLAIDLDDDGELSDGEIARASASILELDRDKDGVLTEDEVRPPRPRAGRRPGPPPSPSPSRWAVDDEDHGRPVARVAKELGVTPEKFREVFRKVRPAGRRPRRNAVRTARSSRKGSASRPSGSTS